MKQILSALDARIIACLIEKQITTPDQYPLSLNALTNACNQKSNRDPEMQLEEREVQTGVDALVRKSIIIERSGFGSRVPKYQQRFCNTEFSELKFTPQELAIVCELLLRGPQTPGELRTRASRMAAFSDVSEVESALESLMRREPHALVVRLPRQPGRRDSCYAQLFTGDIATGADVGPDPVGTNADLPQARESIEVRLTRMEAEIRSLQIAISNLQQTRV
jgi:uncharacterized protein YceH (UPF0502 family)